MIFPPALWWNFLRVHLLDGVVPLTRKGDVERGLPCPPRMFDRGITRQFKKTRHVLGGLWDVFPVCVRLPSPRIPAPPAREFLGAVGHEIPCRVRWDCFRLQRQFNFAWRLISQGVDRLV